MSEYQCYEFVALDRPLSVKQMAELRAISTRAEISPTRFWNEYQWGDLKADPAKLLERYFDAHLYAANWGTHRVMLRLPKERVEAKTLAPYFGRSGAARLATTRAHVILDLSSESDDREYDEDYRGSLAALAPLRAELMRGDLRAAYLAWLLAVQMGDVDEDAAEPPVPPGLAKPTAAQAAMIDFLRLDAGLVATAATRSSSGSGDAAACRRWVRARSAKEKDAWLRRAVDEPELALGGEMLRAFRATSKHRHSRAQRTAGELLALTDE